MIQPQWHPEAMAEFGASAVFYEQRVAGLGTRFVRRVSEAVNQAAASPDLYRCFERKFRKVPIDQFPFVVVYRIGSVGIEIIAIAHGKRHPGYWKQRTLRT